MTEETNAQQLLRELYEMRDKHAEQKYIICNAAFNKIFKEAVIKEDVAKLKVKLDEVAGFKYIVTPYIKDTKPTAFITPIDMNRVCWVYSTYEWETVYIENFFNNNIKIEWDEQSEPQSE